VGAQLAAYIVLVSQARALDEARREAEAANRMKDQFLALVSHELKTPLTSMLAWAAMLRSEDTVPSERTRAFEAIERNVQKQTMLIDEILDLACISSAYLRLNLESVAPASLIMAAVAEQLIHATRRSVRLETIIDESVHPLVVDRIRIVQVISNLLGSAIQITPSGGHVEVHLKRVGTHARIQVVDYGKGIQSEDSPQVFDGFRADPPPVLRACHELGMGLEVAKTLVEAHGGRVRAESLGEDHGSTVSVELPLPAEAPEEALLPLVGIRVLLVDDDDDLCSAAALVLEMHGAEVTAVASAAAALAALAHLRPHVLLSDISMPGENGYDLMRKVAALDAMLPAAALTSFALEADKRRALAAGFQMHLAKPFNIEALVAAVATLTGRSFAKSSGAAIGH
jgi:CheY-like chemotaxis protein